VGIHPTRRRRRRLPICHRGERINAIFGCQMDPERSIRSFFLSFHAARILDILLNQSRRLLLSNISQVAAHLTHGASNLASSSSTLKRRTCNNSNWSQVGQVELVKQFKSNLLA
jgi:hypothetical protein